MKKINLTEQQKKFVILVGTYEVIDDYLKFIEEYLQNEKF